MAHGDADAEGQIIDSICHQIPDTNVRLEAMMKQMLSD